MKITFIGGGNMASAMIGGMLKRGFKPTELRVVELLAQTQQRLRHDFGVQVFDSPAEAVGDADVIVLAIKPQNMREAALSLAPLLTDQLVVTIAAGIRAADLSRWLSGYGNIVRAMPNTPALVQAGITGLYAMPSVAEAGRATAQTLLQAVGDTLWFDNEAALDAVTALSGSGPAYVFYILEAMQEAGVALGLTPQATRSLALATFQGASLLAAQGGEEFSELRTRVTSKGGTTERALQVMEAEGVKRALAQAILAAAERSRELGDQLSKAG